MGVKIVGRHRSIQVEDIFHFSVISDDKYGLSSESNVVRYSLAAALRHFVSQVGGVAVIEIIDWNSNNIYQQLLDGAEPRPRRRPRYRRNGSASGTAD